MPLTILIANSASPRLIISLPMQASTDGVIAAVARFVGVTLAAANPLDHIALAVSRAPMAVGSAGGDREFAASIPAMTASVYGPCWRCSSRSIVSRLSRLFVLQALNVRYQRVRLSLPKRHLYPHGPAHFVAAQKHFCAAVLKRAGMVGDYFHALWPERLTTDAQVFGVFQVSGEPDDGLAFVGFPVLLGRRLPLR